MAIEGMIGGAAVPLVVAGVLAAQARAPFRGTVRDPGGAPIADAVVTCAWAPDFSAPGEPDRVRATTDAEGRATTDAEGRFRMELVVGNAYAVWAIGPPDSEGRRQVVRPSGRVPRCGSS